MLHDLRRDSAAQDRARGRCSRASGLGGREHVPAGRLSYGDRRALEIGLAVAAEPRMLFLDEPTSGPRRRGHGAAGRAGARSCKRALTIVMIEHDMAFLFRLADRISVIHWGQVIAEGTPDDAARRPLAAPARDWERRRP